MAEDKLIEFKNEASGTVFSATLESERHPEASYFQWVKGLPEALRTPGVIFHNTKGPGMFTLTVGASTKTGGLVTREDGAVLCQITSVISQHVIDQFVAETDPQTKANMKAALEGLGAGAPDLGRSAQALDVAERSVFGESLLTSTIGAFVKSEKKS